MVSLNFQCIADPMKSLIGKFVSQPLKPFGVSSLVGLQKKLFGIYFMPKQMSCIENVKGSLPFLGTHCLRQYHQAHDRTAHPRDPVSWARAEREHRWTQELGEITTSNFRPWPCFRNSTCPEKNNSEMLKIVSDRMTGWYFGVWKKTCNAPFAVAFNSEHCRENKQPLLLN